MLALEFLSNVWNQMGLTVGKWSILNAPRALRCLNLIHIWGISLFLTSSQPKSEFQVKALKIYAPIPKSTILKANIQQIRIMSCIRPNVLLREVGHFWQICQEYTNSTRKNLQNLGFFTMPVKQKYFQNRERLHFYHPAKFAKI